VSGIVEESSSKLEYQVDVYRYIEESPYPITQRQNSPTAVGKIGVTGPYLIPLDNAVPIGTRLQLRTNFNQQSG
jgi:hypothetical protein